MTQPSEKKIDNLTELFNALVNEKIAALYANLERFEAFLATESGSALFEQYAEACSNLNAVKISRAMRSRYDAVLADADPAEFIGVLGHPEWDLEEYKRLLGIERLRESGRDPSERFSVLHRVIVEVIRAKIEREVLGALFDVRSEVENTLGFKPHPEGVGAYRKFVEERVQKFNESGLFEEWQQGSWFDQITALKALVEESSIADRFSEEFSAQIEEVFGLLDMDMDKMEEFRVGTYRPKGEIRTRYPEIFGMD